MNRSLMGGIGLVLAGLFCGVAWAANPYVVQGDKHIEGKKLRVDQDGAIVLTTADGELRFPKGTKIVMDDPADLAKAAQMITRREYDPAIQLLNGLVTQYGSLKWGIEAKKQLADAYRTKEDFKSAVTTYAELFAQVPDTMQDDDAANIGYLKSLQGAGDKEKFTAMLEKTIATGPRNAAAVAQVMRGNMKVESGDVEGALYDFLRTAELFRQSVSVQPEALYRSAECFEKLGDKRAEQFYNAVVKVYPQSPFAAKATERLRAKPAPAAGKSR
jgi:TolA-binding protein